MKAGRIIGLKNSLKIYYNENEEMKNNHKKIGILTFHKSINYGSVLQAYALSKTLESQGYKVEIIDYEPQYYKEIYGLYLKNDSVRHILSNLIKRMPFQSAYNKRNAEFQRFRETRLQLSNEKYTFDSDFERLNDKYDVIIVGSDQVWNVTACDCDDVYFLPIKHRAKKIAYAVSLTNAQFKEKRCNAQFRSWISDFDAISSRELSGCERISNFLQDQRKVVNTVDPTILAVPELFYRIKSPRIIKKPYIFLYSISFSQDVIKSAQSLSKQTGLPVFTLMTSLKSYKYVYVNFEHIRILENYLAPEDFLSYIDNAEYVITNSFHGTAFSIIFNKEFYSVCGLNSDGTKKRDERIYNILFNLGISDRILSVNEISSVGLNKKIDYDSVNAKKKELIAVSRKFLSKVIEE